MTSGPATCQHLAYEIDSATRIITVVYIGTLTDDEVIGFYADLADRHAEALTCDYLLDMRYTEWRATPDVIDSIDRLFNRKRTDYRRRIAIVRKAVIAINKQQEIVLRAGLQGRIIRYFTDMDVAQAWLCETP